MSVQGEFRWSRAFVSAGLAILMLTSAGKLHAQDSGGDLEAPSVTIAESRAEASKVIAQRLEEFGVWCAIRKYRRVAEEQHELALQFDPDLASARQKLGYRLDKERWVRPIKRAPFVDAPVNSPAAASVMEKELRRVYGELANVWAEHARHCGRMGDEAAARGAWNQVQCFNVAHPDAPREGGLEGKAPSWLLPAESTPRVAWRRANSLAARVRAGDRGRFVPEPPESVSRGPLTVRLSGSIDGLSGEDVILTMETVGFGLKELGLLPAGKELSPFMVHIITKRELYLGLLNTYGRLNNVDVDWLRRMGGFWMSGIHFVTHKSDSAKALDVAAHMSAKEFFDTAHELKDSPPWIGEGLAYLSSTLVEGTAYTYCAQLEGSGFRKELPGRGLWDELAREDIEAGEDPSMSEFFVSGLNDLSVSAMIKSRSVLLWLIQGDPGLVVRLARASRDGKLLRADAEKVFGAPLEAVDREWSLWARRP